MLAIFGIVLFIIGVSLIVNKIEGDKDKDRKLNIIGSVFIGISILFFTFSLVRVVPAGHVGVVDVFGKVKTNVLRPGINFVNPFAKIIKMSIKTQEVKEVMTVPSKEGLSIALDSQFCYRTET